MSESSARRLRLPAALLGAMVVLGLACAPASQPSAKPGASASGGPAASTGSGQATGQASGPSRVTLAVGSETVSPSPYGDSSPWVYAEWMHIMETLVFYNDAQQRLEPLLAE